MTLESGFPNKWLPNKTYNTKWIRLKFGTHGKTNDNLDGIFSHGYLSIILKPTEHDVSDIMHNDCPNQTCNVVPVM